MPTIDWLKNAFDYGYDSGDILSPHPDQRRQYEESRIGGSYREVFLQAARPYLSPAARVLELGPGRGSWTRALLEYLPQGELHVVDLQDVSRWLPAEIYKGRLTCHRVQDNSFDSVKDNYFDFFWSFGVLCHCNTDLIQEILKNALAKMKPGGTAVHEYADWDKLEQYGWEKGGIPSEFKKLPDNKIWWPRNNRQTMTSIAARAGWTVVTGDLGLVRRDSIIVLKRPVLDEGNRSY